MSYICVIEHMADMHTSSSLWIECTLFQYDNTSFLKFNNFYSVSLVLMRGNITLSVPNGCNFTTNFGSIFLNDVTIFPHEFFIVGIVGTDISHSGF